MFKTAEKLEEIDVLKISNLEMRLELLRRDMTETEKQYKELVKNITEKYCEENEEMSLAPDGKIVRKSKKEE